MCGQKTDFSRNTILSPVIALVIVVLIPAVPYFSDSRCCQIISSKKHGYEQLETNKLFYFRNS